MLARKDESRDTMGIRDGLAVHLVMLTVAIWSTTPLNSFNVLKNEETQSTRATGLSAPLTTDTVLWTGVATVLISRWLSLWLQVLGLDLQL